MTDAWREITRRVVTGFLCFFYKLFWVGVWRSLIMMIRARFDQFMIEVQQ